jgi:FtsZ-binding cell division protein ZapB
MENHALKQHYEYFIEMEQEKTLLQQEFDQLKKAESNLANSVQNS